MEIKLIHPFLVRCHSLSDLLKECNKLNTYCDRLEKQSLKNPNSYDPDHYKGDGFEFFGEALIKLSPVDNRFGICKYIPGQKPEVNGDYGADGYGVGMNRFPATAQFKYRSDSSKLLTANDDKLSNFMVSSQNDYGVRFEDTNNMIIITTAKGTHPDTEKNMLKGKVRTIGYKHLRKLVDNNIPFWDLFRELAGVI